MGTPEIAVIRLQRAEEVKDGSTRLKNPLEK
jgi:hypothetical protein